MGIQGFFRYFKDKSDLYTEAPFILEAKVDENVSRLYIDFINIVYDMVIDFPDELNIQGDVVPIVIQRVLERLELICAYYPNAEIHLFHEGVPTVAKIMEQYSRRIYRKIIGDVKQDLEQRLKLRIVEFDFGLITNPTFIENLNQRIIERFTGLGRNIQIYYLENGPDTIGEAEHRIINHIYRTIGPEGNYNFVIYSPDADVFILSTLLTNNLTITGRRIVTVNTLRRSEPNVNEQTGQITRTYYSVITRNFIQYLISNIRTVGKEPKRLIADIMFAFNILGDDFIPLFKNFSINNLDMIYRAYSTLEPEQYILDYDAESNTFAINCEILLLFFSTPNMRCIDHLPTSPSRDYPFIMRKPNNYLLTENYNKIVYDYLLFNVEKGFYLNEKNNEFNAYRGTYNNSNFGFGLITPQPENYDIQYNSPLVFKPQFNNSRYFLNINNDRHKDDQKAINVNSRFYANKNLLITPSIEQVGLAPEHIDINNMVRNYLEGYEFILDLYFNMYGVVRNNFWYYQYNQTPSVQQIITWLSDNPLPSYVVEHPITYFTKKEYKDYLAELIRTSYENLLKIINDTKHFHPPKRTIGYDDLIVLRHGPNSRSIVFKCREKPYLNKCIINGENILGPIDFLNRERVQHLQVVSAPVVIQTPQVVTPSVVQSNPEVLAPKGLNAKAAPFFPKRGGFKEKYLKYKQKYLQLKNLMNQN